MKARLRAFDEDRRGAVAMILAFTLPAIIGFAAVSIDLGSVYLTTRKLQGVADLAAMAAASDPTNAGAAATATVGDNPFEAAVTTHVVTGQYIADPATPPAQRFTVGGSLPTAAQVVLTTQAPLYFGQMFTGRSGFTVSRTATAAQAQFASFQIGTGLASLQGGIANSLLSALTGSTVNLSVMNYNALASANVDLFQYMSALKTRMSLQAASYSNVLSAQTSTGTALAALSDVLNSQGSSGAGSSVSILAQAAGVGTPVTLSNLLNLGPYAAQDHASNGSGAAISVTALDLADAILTVAQGGRQVQLNLGASVPGLSNVNAFLAIGQRAANSPWLAVDNTGNVIVTTAQARLYLNTQVLPATGTLPGLGASLVSVPIYVELAQAQAKLSSMTCGATGSANAATLSVAPSLGSISLGTVNTSTLNNFGQSEVVTPAMLLNLGLIQATGTATVNLGGMSWQAVPFSAADIAAGTVKTVQTNNLAQATVVSLLSKTQIGVNLFGAELLIGSGPITAALSNTLGAAAPSLDQLLNGLTALLGVQLGTADVKINGLRCKGAALVA